MRGIAVAFLVVAVSIAGCIGGDGGEDLDSDDDAGPTETTGGIEGEVFTENFDPVAAAEVYLVRGDSIVAERTTDDGGKYRIMGLDPGEYLLRIVAPCCEGAIERVRVDAGEVLQHGIRIAVIPEARTYVDINPVWNGFVGCSVNVPLGFQPWTCPDENNDVERTFLVQPGLKTLVVGMTWDPVLTATSDHLRHWLFVPADVDRATHRQEHGPPIEYRIDSTDSISLRFDEIEEETEFRMRVWGPSDGAEVAWQQGFTVHYHLFYGQPAPEGYSALPDD